METECFEIDQYNVQRNRWRIERLLCLGSAVNAALTQTQTEPQTLMPKLKLKLELQL
ncbi:unnamed protein product, partial [Nesidiocoris tenuis]